jgi:hypothetical protein
MRPKGSKKTAGSGRAAGSKNNATIEKELQIEQALYHHPHRLGKDVLEKWMVIFDDKATALLGEQIPVEQQSDEKQVAELVKERDAKIERYSMLAVECGTRLAQYQSPRLRATFVQVDPNTANQRAIENEEARAKLARLIDGVALAQEAEEDHIEARRADDKQPVARLVISGKR